MSDEIQFCHEGGCTCGELRYKVETTPLIVHACHCTWCQRQTGGPHVINALYEAENVQMTKGVPELLDTPSPSGKGQIIARCPTCKVAVWSHYDFGGLSKQISFLRVGTLDQSDAFPPDVHIYTTSKQPWYLIHPSHQSADEFYDVKSTWRPASLARLKALRAANLS